MKKIIFLVILVVAGGWYCMTQTTFGWETYIDSTHGFSIKYPDSLRLESHDGARINFRTYVKGMDECPQETDCSYSLEPNELQMWVTFNDCSPWITNAVEKESNGGTISIGNTDQGGDNPGVRNLLCANKGSENINVLVTTHNSDVELAKNILSSFKFTK